MTRATRPGSLEHYPVGRPALTAGMDEDEQRFHDEPKVGDAGPGDFRHAEQLFSVGSWVAGA